MNEPRWLARFVRPLLIAAMVSCIALALVEALRLLVPGLGAAYLVASGVLASLEASYSFRLLRQRQIMDESTRLRFRVVELVALFIALKVASYVGVGWSVVLVDVQSWFYAPLEFFTLEFIAAVALAFVCWAESTRAARDLEQLGQTQTPHRGYVPPQQRLASRFFWGGAVVMFFSGVGSLRYAGLPAGGESRIRLVLCVVSYFLLGILMLGQVRFIVLHKRWQADGTPVGDKLAPRWVRYGAILVALAALVALLLPTGYTVGLLDAVAVVVSVLGFVVVLVAALLILLVAGPAWLLMLLLGNVEEEPTLPALPSLAEWMPLEPAGPAPTWLQVLKSLLFWGVTLGIGIYVATSYFRDRPELMRAISSFRPIQLLRRLLEALGSLLRGWADAVSQHVPQALRRRRRRGEAAQPLRFFRLGALPPRERVLYYYLSILRRAEEIGRPRRQSQTPYEYGEVLGPEIPQADDELALLTAAFVEARYSQQEIDRQQERRLRVHWKQVRAALQSMRRRSETDELTDEDKIG